MLVNPEATSWYDRTTGFENADMCNGIGTQITTAGRSWNVQLVYSKADADATAGLRKCVASSTGSPFVPDINHLSSLFVYNRYNIAGGIGAAIALGAMAIFQKRSPLAFAAYVAFGMFLGMTATNVVKGLIPEKQKVALRLQIDKLGNLIPQAT